MDKGKVNENKIKPKEQLHHNGFADEEVSNPQSQVDAAKIRTALAGSCPPPVLLVGGEVGLSSSED